MEQGVMGRLAMRAPLYNVGLIGGGDRGTRSLGEVRCVSNGSGLAAAAVRWRDGTRLRREAYSKESWGAWQCGLRSIM
jgi:hypothetical protein